MRGSRVAESPVFCRRPLEPDAGNAAEGSEESEVPGGLPVISALRFPCMAMNTKKFRFNWRNTRGRVPKQWCRQRGTLQIFCHLERSQDISDFAIAPHQ